MVIAVVSMLTAKGNGKQRRRGQKKGWRREKRGKELLGLRKEEYIVPSSHKENCGFMASTQVALQMASRFSIPESGLPKL